MTAIRGAGLDRNGCRVSRSEHWIDKNRDRSNAEGTQKHRRHVKTVEHSDQDPVAWAHVESEERPADPRGHIAEFRHR